MQTNVPHPSARYTCPIGHLPSGMELSNITPRWKGNFLICALHLDVSCQTDFNKRVLTILSITVLYYKQVTTILSIAVCNLGWSNIHTPFISMTISSCSGCWVVAVWLLSILLFVVVIDSGATRVWSHPSMGGKGPSSYGWGVFHIREVDVCLSLFPTQRGTYPLHPPCLVLLTMTQFHEWSHWSQGSLSNGIYGQWCHSLSQMHMFPLMSTTMSHYLWSSPILCGHSSGCPW